MEAAAGKKTINVLRRLIAYSEKIFRFSRDVVAPISDRRTEPRISTAAVAGSRGSGVSSWRGFRGHPKPLRPGHKYPATLCCVSDAHSKSFQPTSQNGEPAHHVIQVELDPNVLRTRGPYDIRLFVPIEFATLLEEGLPVVVTLEQNGG